MYNQESLGFFIFFFIIHTNDNNISHNFDTIDVNSNKFNYKYPVFNYKLYDSNNNIINTLDLFNTTYILNLDNNSIKYPGYYIQLILI